MSRLPTPCSDGDHATPQDSQAYALGRCKILAISSVLPSCYMWCPPSNLFASNNVSSSTRCAWYVQHSQDFSPRAQYVYEKHFHDTASWPLCCISPAPAPSAIALLHCKWLKRTHEVLNLCNSRNLKSWSHIFKFYILLNFHTNKSFTIQELPRSTWGDIFESPFKAQSSKLKAWTSLLPRFSGKRRSSFELWALSFERAFENVTPNGIGCT